MIRPVVPGSDTRNAAISSNQAADLVGRYGAQTTVLEHAEEFAAFCWS